MVGKKESVSLEKMVENLPSKERNGHNRELGEGGGRAGGVVE